MKPIVASPARRYTQLPRYFRWFSSRCVLRQIDQSDATRLAASLAHPAFESCWTANAPQTEADVAAFVAKAHADWQHGARYVMAVMRKQTHEFVGVVELRRTSHAAAWTLDWFVHPRFAGDAAATEMLTAAAGLMFGTLDARKLFVRCPPEHARFERLLNDAGFIEVAAAGSIDARTGRPRSRAVFELGRTDWEAMRDRAEAEADTLPSAWVASSMRLELQLV